MDSTTEPKAEGSSTSQWYVTTYGIPRSDAIRTPFTSEDPLPRRDAAPLVGPRAKQGLFPDDGTRVDRRVDAHLHVVPHDHAKLPQSGVDLDPAEHDLHGRLVESEVRHLRARAEVASLAEDAVAHVILMGHV